LRVAVISDIHANLHALEAVLGAIDADPPDEIWCLGDLVGYGPRPNEVVEEVHRRAKVCLVGNHDLGVTGSLELDEFAPDAAVVARWTQTVLLDEHRAFLESLSPQATLEGVELYHGSPRDPVWEYVTTPNQAKAGLSAIQSRHGLHGHTHIPVAFTEVDGRMRTLAPRAGNTVALGEGRMLLNPGSVGQPRDGDPRASYLVLDTEAGTATWGRTAYDIEAVRASMQAAGLPQRLSDRLRVGA
jgi:predicted phosphodiesterase